MLFSAILSLSPAVFKVVTSFLREYVAGAQELGLEVPELPLVFCTVSNKAPLIYHASVFNRSVTLLFFLAGLVSDALFLAESAHAACAAAGHYYLN